MCRDQKQFAGIFVSLCHVDLGGGEAQVGRFGGNGLYLLSHVTQPPPSDF